MLRLVPPALLLLLPISLACAGNPPPRSNDMTTTEPTIMKKGVPSAAVQVDSEKIILVDLSGDDVVVTPWRVRVESPDQEIIWVTADPSWQVEVEFKRAALPKPCPAPARRCGKRFAAGHPGIYEYDVIVTTPQGTYRVDPELEIRY